MSGSPDSVDMAQDGEDAVDGCERLDNILGMKLADFPALKQLSPRQRLSIAEQLWDSAANDRLPVPDSHKNLIRSRREAYERGEIKTVSIGELAKSIRRRK